MFRLGEGAEEAAEYPLEPALRILRAKLRDRGLIADDMVQLGDEIDYELPVISEGFVKGVPPTGQLGVALAQEWWDQFLKGLRQGRVRDVTLVLIELAGRKKGAGQHQHFMQFIHDGRFANAGIAGHEDQFRAAFA